MAAAAVPGGVARWPWRAPPQGMDLTPCLVRAGWPRARRLWPGPTPPSPLAQLWPVARLPRPASHPIAPLRQLHAIHGLVLAAGQARQGPRECRHGWAVAMAGAPLRQTKPLDWVDSRCGGSRGPAAGVGRERWALPLGLGAGTAGPHACMGAHPVPHPGHLGLLLRALLTRQSTPGPAHGASRRREQPQRWWWCTA